MLKWLLPTLVAALAGLIVLLGSLVPTPGLSDLRMDLLRWATVVGTFALLLAYVNILRVHLKRIVDKRKPHSLASGVLVAAALSSLALVVWQGADGELTQILLQDVLVPGQAALLALTAVTLVLGGMRLLQSRRRVTSVIFLLVAILMLVSTVPFVYPRTLEVVVGLVTAGGVAGMRGLLLGVVLGITMTGLKIIVGVDRPHSNE
jgi:hypothetical protein